MSREQDILAAEREIGQKYLERLLNIIAGKTDPQKSEETMGIEPIPLYLETFKQEFDPNLFQPLPMAQEVTPGVYDTYEAYVLMLSPISLRSFTKNLDGDLLAMVDCGCGGEDEKDATVKMVVLSKERVFIVDTRQSSWPMQMMKVFTEYPELLPGYAKEKLSFIF